MSRLIRSVLISSFLGCGCPRATRPDDGGLPPADLNDAGAGGFQLPLVLVGDVALPGGSTRFDYQDLDVAHGHLIIAHMNDASVVAVNLSDGSIAKVFPNVPTARGVAVASEIDRIFVTAAPNRLVIIDSATLTELQRVVTGSSPDGVAWDPLDQIVAVSDQGNGAVSLIANAGTGARRQVPLGTETGNVVFDAARGRFWITVVNPTPPDQLVEVDPVAGAVTARLDLGGCDGAHGLRLHPDGQSALVACENNATLARVALTGSHAVVTARVADAPDVLSIDPGLGWLYVASETDTLNVFDLNQPGLVSLGTQQPGAGAHTVAVDPATHRVFFPLVAGANGTPVLRVMRPTPRP